MFFTRWMILAGAVAVGAVAVASGGPGAVSGEHNLAGPRDTPIGRLVGYNLGRLMMLRSEAKVTGEQREQIRETISSHRTDIAAVARDLVANRRQLRDAVLSDQPDEAAIRKASADLGTTIGDAAVLASKVRGELRPVFTDEQLELFRRFRIDHDTSVDRWLGDMIANQAP